MKILFIGGTGVISSACSKLCSERGHNLYLFNRGNITLPDTVKYKFLLNKISIISDYVIKLSLIFSTIFST